MAALVNIDGDNTKQQTRGSEDEEKKREENMNEKQHGINWITIIE